MYNTLRDIYLQLQHNKTLSFEGFAPKQRGFVYLFSLF